jgi:hypothetical protein
VLTDFYKRKRGKVTFEEVYYPQAFLLAERGEVGGLTISKLGERSGIRSLVKLFTHHGIKLKSGIKPQISIISKNKPFVGQQPFIGLKPYLELKPFTGILPKQALTGTATAISTAPALKLKTELRTETGLKTLTKTTTKPRLISKLLTVSKRKKPKTKEEKKPKLIGSTEIIPKADWWALTYTQAKKGIEIDALYRPEKKSKYKTLLQKYGAGLTFPTRFIEKKKIRSPLDVTILRNKKKKVRLV